LQFQGVTDIQKAISDTFQQIASGKDYFLVADLEEYKRQPQLAYLLSQNYLLVEQTDRYLLFDLHQKAKSGFGSEGKP
jgi:hypothetical protein